MIAALNKKQGINLLNTDFGLYEKIIIMVPLRGLSPAPEVNNILEKIQAGRGIEIMIEGSDESLCGEAEKTAKANDLRISKIDYISM